MVIKRELSKVERPTAAEEMIRLAIRIDKDKYIATAKVIDITGEKILLLNFFKRSQLIEKKTGAAFRTFISRDDYITQDLTTARVKWKTGSLRHQLDWWFWNTDRQGHDVSFASDQDYVSAQYYMKRYLKGENPNIWDAIRDFQDEVMENRLNARHKKETDIIDQKMELVPDNPKNLDKWAHDIAMADKRYLIYQAESKKKTTVGYCTHCKKSIEIDIQAIKSKNKKRGMCPSCGSQVTFIPNGYFPKCQRDSKWICLIQKVTVGIVARYFRVSQEFDRGNNYKEKFSIIELCRTFYECADPIEFKIDSYEWDVYKQRGNSRWCPDQNKYNCASAVLYTDNLPDALSDSVYQYCALDIYQKKSGCNAIPVWMYMRSYLTKNYLEMFIKCGLINLTNDIVRGNAYGITTDGKTPAEILKISNKYISILREINGTTGELRLLQQCEADTVLPQATDIHEFYKLFGGNDEMLGVINSHISISKFMRYMDKQKSKLPKQPKQQCCHVGMMSARDYTREERIQQEYKDLGKDWLDYISWCALLRYDLKDLYVLLPPDFKKAHDRVMKEYQAYKNEQERKQQAVIMKLIKDALKAAEGIPAMMMKSKGLMIVLPKSGEEIKEEGRTLHHCVGTYIERVAKGETMILFVRKESNPLDPYFTLEYREGKVIQCRGKNNCSMNKEVKAFVKEFEEKINTKDEKESGIKGRKVG